MAWTKRCEIAVLKRKSPSLKKTRKLVYDASGRNIIHLVAGDEIFAYINPIFKLESDFFIRKSGLAKAMNVDLHV